MQVQRSFDEVRGGKLLVELPESFDNHRVEVIVMTVDDDLPAIRRPHPAIAGKMVISGDLLDTVPNLDWDLPA